jgi:organic radical activating enzyme
MIQQISNSLPSDLLRIEYMLGNVCNYKCHYCFPGSNEGDQKWPKFDIVKKNILHLINYYKKNGKKRFHFYLVGGETTLWSELPEFCNFVKSNCDAVIEISTNGSRKINWWNNNATCFDHIDISVHHEYADIPHIIEVADLVYDLGSHVCADVLMDSGHFEKCQSIVDQLMNSKNDWPIIAKTVHINGGHNYSADQLLYFNQKIKRFPDINWYKKTNKKIEANIKIQYQNGKTVETRNDTWLIQEDQNKFKGMTCTLGVDIIKISSNGDITGNCQQYLFSNDFHFSLYQENFVDVFDPICSPVICTKDICPCPRETVARKWHV